MPAGIASRAAHIATDAPVQFEAFRGSHALAGTGVITGACLIAAAKREG